MLLSPELRRLVDAVLDEALKRMAAEPFLERKRLLRDVVVRHFLLILEGHREAARRRAEGREGSWRELCGTAEDNIETVGRIPFWEAKAVSTRSVAAAGPVLGEVVPITGRRRRQRDGE